MITFERVGTDHAPTGTARSDRPALSGASDDAPTAKLRPCDGNRATAVYETLIRDRFDLNPSRVLMPADYALRDAVNVSSSPGETLTLLDLTRGNAVRYGVPSDVIRHSVHTDGQRFSEFVHAEMPSVDGFLYSSRLTERSCVAIYERACHKLAAGSRQ